MNYLPRRLRLVEFYHRLLALPPADSVQAVFVQLCETLNAVEDELSGVPYDGVESCDNGRMCPPLPDSIRPDTLGRPGVVRYRTKKHNTFIGDNGALEIRRVDDNSLEFTKLGRDGRGIGGP